MTKFCHYKNLFGAPGTGAHSYRFAGVAIVDVILTILAAFAISWISKWPFWYVLLGLFLLGIFLHWLFCVQTTVGKFIFGN
jgi:hypothetical protein